MKEIDGDERAGHRLGVGIGGGGRQQGEIIEIVEGLTEQFQTQGRERPIDVLIGVVFDVVTGPE